MHYLHFVFYCTHVRMSYVLNSYLLTYLVASYNMRPGNEEDLFLFQRFINLSLTYLLT